VRCHAKDDLKVLSEKHDKFLMVVEATLSRFSDPCTTHGIITWRRFKRHCSLCMPYSTTFMPNAWSLILFMVVLFVSSSMWDSFNLGACQVQFGWTPQWICYGFFPKGGGKSVVLITSPICTFHYHVDWVWLYVTNVIIPTSITLKIHHLYLMGRQPNIRCMSSLRAQCTPG